jgi:hypothetical protein
MHPLLHFPSSLPSDKGPAHWSIGEIAIKVEAKVINEKTIAKA